MSLVARVTTTRTHGLSDRCATMGQHDLTLQHVSDVGHLRRLWLRDGLTGVYISDSSLDEIQPDARRAVLVVHGIERDGHRYWKALARAARRAGADVRAETYLMAPQFFTRKEVRMRGLGADTLAWASQAWKQGDLSRNGGGVSAFAVVDTMIQRLLHRDCFPRLAQIVIVGHSAGAQFVQRYAAASRSAAHARAQGVALRHIVVGPSSYLYLDDTRRGFGPVAGYGRPCRHTVLRCPGYDHYKYGLRQANAYVSGIGALEIRREYAAKEVVYLVGEHDNDPDDQHLDRSPAAMLQGRDRLDRCLAYRDHLARLYGGVPSTHVFQVVPGMRHQGARILRSPIGLRWLFDVDFQSTRL